MAGRNVMKNLTGLRIFYKKLEHALHGTKF
jgi:hypothetical protein